MVNYFPVALTGTARSWLMNLTEGTLHSWSELCCQFTANFDSAYARTGNETDLHANQQCPGESLCSFVQQFSQVRNTIPRIFNASVVVAFLQGVRDDEKMLQKLTTHDVQDGSSAWQTSAPRRQRTAPGTPQPPRRQSERASPASGPRPKAAAAATTTRRRRLVATSRWPERPLPQLQWWVGAVVG
jgi:hypothetical protein